MAAAPDGGVVHQHVQLAVGRDGRGDGVLPVGFAGYIQVDVRGLAAQFVDCGGHGHSVGVQHVGDDHFRPLAGEQPRLRRPLPSGAAGNQRHFSLQSHRIPLIYNAACIAESVGRSVAGGDAAGQLTARRGD